MVKKLEKFINDHNKEAHGFAAFIIFLGTLYATNAEMQHYVDGLLVSYPQLGAILSIVFIVYRNYASSHSKEALTRADDLKPKEEK